MKNNKGFSLVELIIVIAIMAILVGVMAPQLIKYIEKTNVSSDAQLCDSVRSAITTSMLDPEVIAASNSGIPTSTFTGLSSCFASNAFGDSCKEILGVTSESELVTKSSVGSTKANGWKVVIENGNAVTVYLTASDATGKKSASSSQKIGSGPAIGK